MLPLSGDLEMSARLRLLLKVTADLSGLTETSFAVLLMSVLWETLITSEADIDALDKSASFAGASWPGVSPVFFEAESSERSGTSAAFPYCVFRSVDI